MKRKGRERVKKKKKEEEEEEAEGREKEEKKNKRKRRRKSWYVPRWLVQAGSICAMMVKAGQQFHGIASVSGFDYS
jgi:predicted ribosome quality control (RQC) complex YloA/Tae2 family protein